MYVRFEGSTRQRFRRWHMVEGSAAAKPVTLCGRYVDRQDELVAERGSGLTCLKCTEAMVRRAESAGKA